MLVARLIFVLVLFLFFRGGLINLAEACLFLALAFWDKVRG